MWSTDGAGAGAGGTGGGTGGKHGLLTQIEHCKKASKETNETELVTRATFAICTAPCFVRGPPARSPHTAGYETNWHLQ